MVKAGFILVFIGPSTRQKASPQVAEWAITYSITLSRRRTDRAVGAPSGDLMLSRYRPPIGSTNVSLMKFEPEVTQRRYQLGAAVKV